MKIGDKLIFIGNNNNYNNFTYLRNYKIFNIDNTMYNDDRTCWVYDDNGNKVYFRESQSIDDYFKCIKYERKIKLEKIFSIYENR